MNNKEVDAVLDKFAVYVAGMTLLFLLLLVMGGIVGIIYFLLHLIF